MKNHSLEGVQATGLYFQTMIGRCALLAGPLFMACLPSASAQLPKRLEKCLPYPTLAQEIRERQAAPTQVKVHVVRADFSPEDGIPADAREEISSELQSSVFRQDADRAYLKDLANEIEEVGAREPLRDRGYFKVAATASLTTQWEEGADIYVAVDVHADLGPQYRTGDIRVQSADPDTQLVMSPEVLRGAIPLQSGELFSVERVRTGLENLGRLYGREGYVDMTPEPDTQVDDDRKTIDLVIRIDQQMQYRVGSIEFLGVNAVTREKLLESLPKPGEVLSMARLDEFFKVNKAILPSDVLRYEDMSMTRNTKEKTVAILFDFRTCHSNSN